MYSQTYLLKIKKKALRRGVWYKYTDIVERGIYNLTTKLVVKVESVVLSVILLKILKKLKNGLKGEFVKTVENIGISLVLKKTYLAIVWGYQDAKKWVEDYEFARYLTLMSLNK